MAHSLYPVGDRGRRRAGGGPLSPRDVQVSREGAARRRAVRTGVFIAAALAGCAAGPAARAPDPGLAARAPDACPAARAPEPGLAARAPDPGLAARAADPAAPRLCGPEGGDRSACHKPLTVLVYMAAGGGLQAEALRDLREMECPPGNGAPDAASTAGADVVVQLDLREPAGRFRLHMERSAGPCGEAASLADVTSPRVGVAPEETVPPAERLERFLEWGIRAYPSELYAVIVRDHGPGAGGRGAAPGAPGGMAIDPSAGALPGARVLRAALAAASARGLGGRPFDVVASDGPLFASLEVATEIAGVARFIAGSEQEGPAGGLPYHRLVPWLNGARPMPPAPPACRRADLACRIAALFPEAVRAAAEAGEGRSARERAALRRSFTMSALDAEAVRGPLHAAMHRLGAAIAAWIREDPVRAEGVRALFAAGAQGPREPRVPAFRGDERDVGVLLARLAGLLVEAAPARPRSTASRRLAAAIVSVRAVLSDAVIAAAFGERYGADRYPGIAGVSVWIPPGGPALRAGEGAFARSRFFEAPGGEGEAPGWKGWLDILYPGP